jgi:hypothetical protein
MPGVEPKKPIDWSNDRSKKKARRLPGFVKTSWGGIVIRFELTFGCAHFDFEVDHIVDELVT